MAISSYHVKACFIFDLWDVPVEHSHKITHILSVAFTLPALSRNPSAAIKDQGYSDE